MDIPVHVLSPSSCLLDVGRTFLVPLNVLTLEDERWLVVKENRERNFRNITLVDPKPVIPIIAIIASSSSFRVSIASPSSASPSSSVCVRVTAWEAEANGCAREVLGQR